ncbi:hypothetical protein C9J44_14200 [Photobacterium sp. GB-27]|uniref:hypothetical protein n=1 Tax=unclassified Photobacterium TaxID=2628852 RepID=UPI000D16E98A|nr:MULTISPECIES: hypothetical protein [unclassified Photobacterium]PSV34937.1 hypothetical protein C9J44_14200 [Photobacterium sp. GB-27]PSV35471.1 hypothetical protein C9J38_15405 [Photobacterium sp. GB-210]
MYIAWKSPEISEDAIYYRAIEQLISIREIKKSEIKNHFDTTATLLATLAFDPSIQNAIRDFEHPKTYYYYAFTLIPNPVSITFWQTTVPHK